MSLKSHKLLYVLIISLVLISGCKSISDKFVRKPHSKGATIIAPEEDIGVNPRVVYEKHFVFAKVWLDEFRCSVDSKSEKRQRKSFEQAVRNMKILADYYPAEYPEKKELLYKYIRELKGLYKQLQDLERKRMPLTRIKARIEEIRREFHLNFLPDKQPEDIWNKMKIY